jgi:signal transduction histidine kinase/integral membrane sensor domain MASE1/ActR/RegA family two-component response regulator
LKRQNDTMVHFDDQKPLARPPHDRMLRIGGLLILAVVYFASAKLGLSMAFVAEQVSPVWPPTGIALAAVLLFGYRVWPAIAIAAFLANWTAHEPIPTAFGIALGNTLEALLAAWLLRRARFDNSLERVRDVIALILLAAALSTMAAATIGVTSLCLGGVELPALRRPIEWSDFTSLWSVWWLGDAMGALVVAPAILTWTTRRNLLPWRRPVEAAALLAGLVATSLFAFVTGWITNLEQSSLAYVVFPFVIWAALRFGQPGTTLVTLIASGLTILATLHSLGPFGLGPLHDRLLMLQMFMGVVAITGLLLGAALAERHRADAAVRASKEELAATVDELQTLLNMLPVGIFIAQDASCSHITMNPAGAAMLNIPHGADASKTGPHAAILPFRVLRGGAEVPGEELPMQRAARTGIPVAGEEFDVVRGDGTQITLYEYASPLFDATGNVRGCLGVFVDITDRKQVEEALKQIDRRKDEFLATLAHELRNPLAPIRAGVDFLRITDLHDPASKEVLAMLDRQVHQIGRLVNDLLDVSRVTSGKVRLELESTDLAAVVARAVETSRPLIDNYRHELAVSLPADPLPLHADPTRLAQVFSNLLNNAAKYSDPGGRIVLSASQRDGAAVVRVRDTGHGIDPHVLPRVFDLFVQGDHSLTRAEGGLGIGLTLVHRIVEMHGGSVQAFSDGPGKGSEFVIRLPLSDGCQVSGVKCQRPELLTPETAHQPQGGHPTPDCCRVLIVDDNIDAARSLQLLLKRDGHDVRTTHTGMSALETVPDFRPDVVLLDIGMPELDGYEVARCIRQQPYGNDLALIAVTGWGQPDDLRRATAAGFNDHLTKPVDLAKLKDIIARLCSAAQATENAG